MHPEDRKSLRITIENRYFVDKEMCYYQIKVDDEVLDTWANNYQWTIEFPSLVSVVAVLGNGPNLGAASNTTRVEEGQTFQYNATGNQLFVSFTAEKAKKKHPDPSFSVRIRLLTIPIPEEDREPLPEEE